MLGACAAVLVGAFLTVPASGQPASGDVTVTLSTAKQRFDKHTDVTVTVVIAKISLGAIYDRFGLRFGNILGSIACIIACVALCFPATDLGPIVAAVSFGVGTCMGTITPTIAASKQFGMADLGKVTGLVSAVYNGVTGFFSDILSYVRLMALMLSGAVLAQVFNMLGATTGNVVGFVVIALIGNALNLALNLLGCYVHDMRLQFLEFFGRFYKEGGKSYRPLSVETQYVEVMKEDN